MEYVTSLVFYSSQEIRQIESIQINRQTLEFN